MRIVVDAHLGAGDADLLQQLDRPRPRLGGRQRKMGLDGLDELMADRIERIEAGQRVLEDGADAGAAHLAHLLVGQIVDAPALEADFAAGNAARRFEQADDGSAGQRLAGARFAHHAQHLARRDVEGDVVDREQGAAARRELDAEVADFEKRLVVRCGGHRACPIAASD